MDSILKGIKNTLVKLCFEQSLEQITPPKYVYHVSSPNNRDSIAINGLEPRLGNNIWDLDDGYIPAIYVSLDSKILFYDNYDNDVWRVSTDGLPNKFYVDGNYKNRSSSHLLTYNSVPPQYLKLVYKGTGIDLENESEELEKFIKTPQYKKRYQDNTI